MILYAFQRPEPVASGFVNAQFRKLDALFSQAAAAGTLLHRTIDCDFDAGLASFAYCKSVNHAPLLSFHAVRKGPRMTMFELYRQNKGCITRSEVFERVYERLREEIEALGPA